VTPAAPGAVTLEPSAAEPVLSNPQHAALLPPSWRMAPSTCPWCGSPRTCCAQGRTRGATGHGEPAEDREGGDALEGATEAASGAQGSPFAECGGRRPCLSPSPPTAGPHAPIRKE
jgi:hypothetical protein